MSDARLTEDADRTSTQVVEAIADALDVDPVSMQPPLYDVIDLDAIDRLFGSETATAVTFEYNGCTVTVREDEVVVDGTAYGS